VHRFSRKVTVVLVRFDWNWYSWQILENYANKKFHENPSIGSRFDLAKGVIEVLTVGQTDITKVTVALLIFENMPRTLSISKRDVISLVLHFWFCTFNAYWGYALYFFCFPSSVSGVAQCGPAERLVRFFFFLLWWVVELHSLFSCLLNVSSKFPT
jgi:hypothetical protein